MFINVILIFLWSLLGVDVSQCTQTTQTTPYGHTVTGYVCPINTNVSPAIHNGTPMRSRHYR